jgi:hypothetical protein
MFQIELPNGMLERLGKMEWWRVLLEYRDEEKNQLFVAVRYNYLSVYVRGRAIFKEIRVMRNGEIKAIFDRRYFHGPEANSGDLIFNGEKVYCETNKTKVEDEGATAMLRDFDRWVKMIRNYKPVILEDGTSLKETSTIQEKECLASRAVSPNVINLEMAISIKGSNGRNVARRIDMVHLVRSEVRSKPGVAIVFTEAKLFSNKELRKEGDAPAPVVTQVLDYRDYLEKNKDHIRTAYQTACKLLIPIRKDQGITVDRLLHDVAEGVSLHLVTQPRVLVFRTSENPGNWEEHRVKLFEHGIAVEVVDLRDLP